MTIQQAFDQASAHATGGKCQEAVPEFEALEKRPGYKPGTLSAAMISLLKGQCLALTEREGEGEAAIRQAIPRLRQQGAQFDPDIASAFMALGDAAMMRRDYAGARGRYEEAAALPDAVGPALLNVKLAQATAFDGGEAPLRYADAAIKAALAIPDMPKARIAEFRMIRARILLNQGRNAEGYAELKEALKLTGSLDLKVNLADVALRGDIALAAQLNGDTTKAREYLAYTGAGRIAESPFTKAISMTPPICGTQTGLRPEDFAVVDFAVDPKDGSVLSARTIYTRGSAEVAAQFAEAVSKWVWNPEDIKKIPNFFLLASRIEIRCTTSGQQAPGMLAPLKERFAAWASAQLGMAELVGDRPAVVARLQAIAAVAAAKGDAVRQVAAYGMLTLIGQATAPDLYGWATKALALADKPGVPADAGNSLKVIAIDLRSNWYGSEKLIKHARQTDFLALLESPAMQNDALAADSIRLAAATPRYGDRKPDNEVALLQAVATDTRLPDTHPVRQVANLRLANDAARRGDYAGAQTYFKATGLTEEQCAYLGVTPAMRRNGLSSNDFPHEALQWGFGGWVQLEYDIQANGRAASIRPLIAYPPFVFSKAAAASAKDFVFQASYRPAGGQACAADRRSIVYRP